MKTYYWQGIGKNQERNSGTIEARSFIEAKIKLYAQDITPLKISRHQWALFKKQIKAADIVLLTQQLAAMLATGISLIAALSILSNSTRSMSFRDLLNDIKKNLEQGLALHQALATYPRYFNQLYCDVVHAGEQSGTLAVLLGKLATHDEKKRQLIQKIRKAITYPIAVIVVAMIITLILLTQVIPQFATLFSQTSVKLPAITQLVLHLSQLLQHQGLLIFLGSGLLFGGFIMGYRRSLKVRLVLQQGLLKLPFFGGLLQKTIIARFCQTFSIMITARIPLPDTLNMLANTCGNLIFQRQIHMTREKIINGESFYKALQAATLFPPLIVQLVAVGEETGELATMLGQAANFYEQSVDTTVEQLNTLLEPLIMIMLGILIGGLIIAMYLPIFKIGQLV